MYLKKVIFKKFNLLLIVFCTVILLFIWSQNSLIDDIDRKQRLKTIDELIRKSASQLACKQPNLPVTSPEILKFMYDVPKINCSKAGQDWVKCEGSECFIKEQARVNNGPIKCSFIDVLRIDDYQLTDGDVKYSEEYYKLEQSDVVRVSCKSSNNKWSQTLTGIRMDNEIWDRAKWDNLPKTALKMNVLMFGLDSLSRNSFIRKLPKTYEYLTKQLDAIVLKGYNIIGDGTPQALTPILTGKTELELPDVRKRLKHTTYVDSYPFIWNDYKNVGYVTGFFEDVPQLGTFTYRLNGFKDQPTDHYMRPYYLASLTERNKWPKLCAGETPRHKVMLNLIKDFFTIYNTKPKFLFGFHGELSHDDYNLIGVADDDILEFLTDLKESGVLNNTILIMMADHGHRFAEIRNTVQGKLEERLPFFSFTFPKWFKNQYHEAYKNFKENNEVLTTPFDIHATLKSILDLKDTGVADLGKRSLSLFTKIPKERSCLDAYIEPHWCACLEWQNISTSDIIVQRLTNTLIATINNFTQDHSDICATLSLGQIYWVIKMAPNENLLKYNKNADIDGFVADLTARMNVNKELYQIKVMLVPGNSIFEASITYDKNVDRLDVKMSDISRINMYKDQAQCVEDSLPHLRKYCFCKNTS